MLLTLMYKRLLQDLTKMLTRQHWSGSWDRISYKLKDFIGAAGPQPYSDLILGLLATDVKTKKFKGAVIIIFFANLDKEIARSY